MLNFNEYKIKGYQISKGLFDPKIIDTVRNEAQGIFLRQMKQVGYDVNQIASEGDFNQYLFRLFNEFPHLIISSGKHIQHLISLHRLSLDEKIINGLKELGIKTPNICTRPVLFFNTKKLAKKQVYWKTDAHQDWRSMQGSLNSMVVWLPLCDVDTSLGALEVIPGSHLNGLQSTEMVDSFGLIPENKLEREKFIPVELKRGDALFFSSFLYHQSGDNSTENDIRWSCHFRYNDMDEPEFIERGFPHPYVYYPNPDLITPSYPPEGRLVSYFE
jgi:phytanoyl-CoA hydroxylase